MKIHYISPSTLPSRAANAVHVVMQCDALAKAGADVTLFARSATPKEKELLPLLREAFGVSFRGVDLVAFHTEKDRATSLRIALMALFHMKASKDKPDIILSRNLYASYFLGVWGRKPILFETHQLETGWRKYMQRRIMTRPWVTTIVISQKLQECLTEHHSIAPAHPLVLHDAAPEGEAPIPPAQRRQELVRLHPEMEGPWESVCGYFGHLYQGRGIEIIEGMARARPRSLFLVFGGNEEDVIRLRRANQLVNMRYMGHVPHARAQAMMRRVDVLLMPYQAQVSIGAKGHDTARWMSPMKMFEYMAAGVPLISSDLPVLREILTDGETALLAPPDSVENWIAALDSLVNDTQKAERIAQNAYAAFQANHSWGQRAKRIMKTHA